MKYIFILFGLFTSALFSCSDSKNAKQSAGMYDLDSLIVNQSSLLKAKNPLVNKTWVIDNKMETKKLKIENWNKELEIFKNCDINKLSLKSSYAYAKTNYSLSYILKPKEKLYTKSLTVTTKNDTTKITILASYSNFLFSDKNFMHLILFKGKLTHYDVDNVQKLAFSKAKNKIIKVDILP